MSGRSDAWVGFVYHDVIDAGIAATPVAQRFAVPVPAFRSQLDALRDAGFRVCSLDRAMRTMDAKVVAVTFDDGHLSQYTHAFPELAARDMTATFFVTTSWIGRRPGYATWDQLREMKAAGMSIQSHTHTHPFLSELSADALDDELRLSREALDQALDQTTDMIALPGGDFPQRSLRESLVRNGYRIVATSRWGTNAALGDEAPIYIRRCTVRATPAMADFMRIAAGDPAVILPSRFRAAALNAARSLVGASRYSRWRSRVLQRVDAVMRWTRREPVA